MDKDLTNKYNEFFLMDTDTAAAYAVEKLGFFESGEEVECSEIGDGNINYVFILRSKESGRSLVIKQADRLLRSSGRPLDMNRSSIEASILRTEHELAPDMVPEVYHYDEIMHATAMEDVSDYENLRKALDANRFYDHLADNISTFMADTLLPMTDLVMDAGQKKQNVKFYTNPELCEITEDLVLTEPYYDYKGRNVIFPGNEDFVEEQLYSDTALHTEVAKLRLNYMNNAQTLLHGDLHSGSIFINEKGIKVLDPEFAFYGPAGYDIGNVIGNLFFAVANKRFAGGGSDETAKCAEALEKCIEDVYDMTKEKLASLYDELVEMPLYRTDAFREMWIGDVMADSLGYAGTEIIRRTVGDSKVMEVTSVTDPDRRIPMERALVKLGKALIMQRRELHKGSDLTALI